MNKLLALLVFVAATAAGAAEVDVPRLQGEAVDRLQQYLRIDTTNPPGNETRGVEYLASLLRAEGIPFQTRESAPGRGNLWARLEGGPGKAIVLLHHIDVVPWDSRYWTVEPFGGEIRDGYLYGRGALDTKGLGIMQLQTFIALHRSGARLSRPVILVATADEEAGGEMGAGWLLKHVPEIFADTEFLLNEGGVGLDFGGKQILGVEVLQKTPLWLRLTARDQPGHGSAPRPDTAVTRLVRALERIRLDEFDPRVLPAVDAYAKARAAVGAGKNPAALADLGQTLRDSKARLALQADEPSFAALTHDTCAITRLEGSSKINVIPPEASAELDCRLLPDRDPDAFIAKLTALIDDPAVEIKTLMSFKPTESPTDTPMFEAIRAVAREHYPEATVAPSVVSGFTDSHFFREHGIVAYGFAPVILAPAELQRAHGNDERLSVENIRKGTAAMYALLRRMAVAD